MTTMIVKLRRVLQQLGGRNCMNSRSIWVDVFLIVTFLSLLIVVYQEQYERALQKRNHRRKDVEIQVADGKKVKVLESIHENDSEGAEDPDKKQSAPLHPPIGEIKGGNKYKNISAMAELVGDKNILQSIQNILGQIPQSFGSACDNAFYPDSGQIPASLIIVFYDYQLYDLKVTLSSIQVNTPDSLIKEIIVIDDGSTDSKVITDAEKYVSRIPKAKLVRNEKHEGEVLCRMKGVRKAKSSTVVFLSTNVVVAPGWLEPIADYLHRHKSAIVVPHLDKIFEPYKYETVPRTWVGGFFWSLAIKLVRAVKEESNILLGVWSPTLKGDVYATTTNFIKKIGLYDVTLAGSGAEHIELSLRTWMCSGTIKVVRCSHAGILSFLESSPIDDAMSAWRVSQLWMSDYVSLTAQLSGLHYNPTSEDIKSVAERKKSLAGKCDKNIRWYMNNVATNVYFPSKNAKTVGLLQVKNGFCCNLVVNKTRIALETCNPDIVGQALKDMTFEHTDIGQIKVQGRCLASVDSYVLVQPCLLGENAHQIWLRRPDGTYRCKKDGLCLLHVSDPLLKHKGLVMQTLMAQDCEKDKSETKNFSAFLFIPPG